jgi:hypothetical protein
MSLVQRRDPDPGRGKGAGVLVFIRRVISR